MKAHNKSLLPTASGGGRAQRYGEAMNDLQLEEEEKILLDFLKWSGGPEDDPREKSKNKIQAYVISGVLFIVSSVLLYLDHPSFYQAMGGLAALCGCAFLFMATIITGAKNSIKYTEKYIDTESIRKRLEEIKIDKSNQQGPSDWTR